MGYAFISYSSKNQSAADAMKKLLDKNGIASWMAPGDIPPGMSYAQAIVKAIRECSCMVLLLTNATQSSAWVPKEVERAINYKKPLIPIRLEEVTLNEEFECYISTNQVTSLSDFSENTPEMRRVIGVLKEKCGEEHTVLSDVRNFLMKRGRTLGNILACNENGLYYRKTNNTIVSVHRYIKDVDSIEQSTKSFDDTPLFLCTDIISICGVYAHLVGLKKNGTVIATGKNLYGECNTKRWRDIVEISAGGYHTVGLMNNGWVVAVGSNKFNQCSVDNNAWENIISVSTGWYHTVGLKNSGEVVAVGRNHEGQCNVDSWKNIVAISAGDDHTVGLKADGTVVAVGSNRYNQCSVGSWTNIVAISASSCYTIGLRADGTVVAVGDNSFDQCDTGEWDNIIDVFTDNMFVIGLKSDGTLVFTDPELDVTYHSLLIDDGF